MIDKVTLSFIKAFRSSYYNRSSFSLLSLTAFDLCSLAFNPLFLYRAKESRARNRGSLSRSGYTEAIEYWFLTQSIKLKVLAYAFSLKMTTTPRWYRSTSIRRRRSFDFDFLLNIKSGLQRGMPSANTAIYSVYIRLSCPDLLPLSRIVFSPFLIYIRPFRNSNRRGD
jgi:hypothetical protein